MESKIQKSLIQFKNYERKREAPFIIYADFKNQKVLGANVSRS